MSCGEFRTSAWVSGLRGGARNSLARRATASDDEAVSIIHRTTLKPTKLELLADWLPKQPWYQGAGTPELTKAGGFRLDDPAGEVGIEFMAATDTSGPEPVTYHVPMAYRGAPLEGAPDDALIGTTEHGVLGGAGCTTGPRTRCSYGS